jgi:hypothetical protein
MTEADYDRATVSFDNWCAHLTDCPTCERAIRGRLTGMMREQMAPQCCDAGRPLFNAWNDALDLSNQQAG